MYPDDYAYQIDEKVFSKELCGETRQGHFTGVLTVLMKLFLMIKPDKVFLGEKDYQQLELVRGMVNAFMDIEIVSCPTKRESDGLAMSSRNKNLTPNQRRKAPKFLSSSRRGETIKRYLMNLQDAVLGLIMSLVGKIDAMEQLPLGQMEIKFV